MGLPCLLIAKEEQDFEVTSNENFEEEAAYHILLSDSLFLDNYDKNNQAMKLTLIDGLTQRKVTKKLVYQVRPLITKTKYLPIIREK